MAELNWTNYIAIGTGIIGTITGIAGAIMGFIGYQKANSLKSLDLRLEIRRAVSDARSLIGELPGMIESANGSRQAVAAGFGLSTSGWMEQWANDIQADRNRLQELSNGAPAANETFLTLSHAGLEAELVSVHKLQTELNQLRSKYEQAVQADDEARRQIRADQCAWFERTREKI